MLLVIYTVMGIFGEIDISFLLPFISVMIMISTFSYDSYNHWDAYVVSFPHGRENSVRAKYIATILLILGASFLTTLLSFMISYIHTGMIPYEQIFYSLLGTLFGTLFVLSLMYPIIYKFGIEKARIGIFIIVFGIVALGSFMAQYLDLSFLAKSLSFLENYFVLIFISIMILMSYVSYKISERIMRKKEF